MKPEVQQKPFKKSAPAPQAVPEEPPLFSAEGFRRNRTLIVGVGITLGAVLLALAGVGVRSYLVASANEKAWVTLGKVHPALSRGAADTPKKSPDDVIRDIEAAMIDLKGTSAEPWAVYELGNAYFDKGDVQKARDLFQDLKTRFPSHALCDPNATYHHAARVDAALRDCDAEMEWVKTHGKPAPQPSGSTATTSAPEEKKS
jgi:hypothetical protein